MQLMLDIFNDEAILFDAQSTLNQNLKPYEIPLSAFMADAGWEAKLDPEAKGESKGNYYMFQPDGSKWLGGWIGKHKSAVEAKSKFHYNQVRLRLHWQADVPERVLASYNKLLHAHQNIMRLKASICLKEGPYVAVQVGSEMRHFHILDVPMYCRVSLRGFVKNHSLIDPADQREPWGESNDYFGPIEEMCIALTGALSERLSENHRPNWLFPDGKLRSNQSGERVRIRIPEVVDDRGFCRSYRTAEGITGYAFNMCPRLLLDGTNPPEYHELYPSQVASVHSNSEWVEYKELDEDTLPARDKF